MSALDHHAAKVFVCVTIVLFTVSLAALTARITFKIRSKLLLTPDDYLIVVGAVRKFEAWARSASLTLSRSSR